MTVSGCSRTRQRRRRRGPAWDSAPDTAGPADDPRLPARIIVCLPAALPLVAGGTGTSEGASAPEPPLARTGADAAEAIVSPQLLRALSGQHSVYRPLGIVRRLISHFGRAK